MTATLTNGQKEDILEGALEAMLAAAGETGNDYFYAYVYDFTDAWVVYSTGGGIFQIDYAMDDDNAVTFSGDPVAVYSVTTYEPVVESKGAGVPLSRRKIEYRKLTRGTLQDVRADIHLHGDERVEVRSEPLIYRQGAPFSYFKDLMVPDTRGGAERLQRHAQEMDTINKARDFAARQRLDDGFEYRVEPNTTPGTGGYFTPPAWLNSLFATAKRPKRVLADLIEATFLLPSGVSSINLPVLTTGTAVAPQIPNSAVEDQDFADAAGSSIVQIFAGTSDAALQLLEQSPAGAHLDWAIFQDLTESYDAQVETALVYGLGAASQQLLGVVNVPGINKVVYTDAAPTGAAMYPSFGKAFAQIGDGRDLPPEVWLARSARWAWFMTQESTAGLPFGVLSPFFMGNTDETPDPIGAIVGLPIFLDGVISATLGTGANQDQAIALRPTDLILLEGIPKTAVMLEPGSGNLGVRLQLHNSVAFISNRYPSGIATVGGTGFVVQSGE